MRHVVPRLDPARLALALAVVAPTLLLGGLANAAVTIELAGLDLIPETGLIDVDALARFKAEAEVLIVGAFAVLAVLTLAVLYSTRGAVAALNLHATIVLVLLALLLAAGWSLGLGRAAARIGLGTAAWGLSWVLVALHLFAFLRAVPHRRWVWVTGALAAAYFLVSVVLFLAATLATLEAAAVLAAVAGVAAALYAATHRSEVTRMWGYAEPRDVRLPAVTRGALGFVALYMLLLLGLMGAAYQHQFDYRPVQSVWHHFLMAMASLAGVLVFGALARSGGRRVLLYALPVATGLAVLFQAGFALRWPAVVALGLMLGAVFYLLQYLAEATGRVSRAAAFLLGAGAVAVLGAGGTVTAQLGAIPAFTPERLLVLQVAALLLIFLIAPQLPETSSALVKEEEIQEYLEIARRVQEEHQ